MANFPNNFDTTDPEPSSLAKNIDTFIRQDTKKAIDERYELEHISLEDGVNDDENPDGQGRHKAGLVGCMGYGDLADRAALGVPGRGAIFQCTEADPSGPYPAGTIYRYETPGLGWIPSNIGLTGLIMASDEEAVAGIVEDKAINPYQLQSSVNEKELVYSVLTGGTESLDYTGIGSRTYNIADFVGTNVVPENIRALYIRCYARGKQVDTGQTAIFPDDTIQTINMIRSETPEETASNRTVYRLPINRGDSVITIANFGGSDNEFEILACDQWVYWEVV